MTTIVENIDDSSYVLLSEEATFIQNISRTPIKVHIGLVQPSTNTDDFFVLGPNEVMSIQEEPTLGPSFARTFSGSARVAITVTEEFWILGQGVWDDSGVWIDAETWNDGV